MSYVDFPYGIDERGRTREATLENHVRDLIELVLFTAPGERVNRPDFGTGLLKYVFEPDDATMAMALQATAHASLQLWLGELLEVRDVAVETFDSTLTVTVQYVLRATGESQIATVRGAV